MQKATAATGEALLGRLDQGREDKSKNESSFFCDEIFEILEDSASLEKGKIPFSERTKRLCDEFLPTADNIGAIVGFGRHAYVCCFADLIKS